MKVNTVITLSLLLLSQQTLADSINYQLSCPNGGTRSVSGEYTPLTGNFDLTAELTECISSSNIISNGSIKSVGILKLTSVSTASLDATITSTITRKYLDNETSNSCEKKITGSYNLTTSYLDGTVTSNNCEKSGMVYMPIAELVAGLEENDSIESRSNSTNSSKSGAQ